MKQAYDINTSVGGPIVRDDLWFYASARWQQNQNYIAGLYRNANEGIPASGIASKTETSGVSSRSSRTV